MPRPQIIVNVSAALARRGAPTATGAAFFAFAPVGYVGSERCVSFYFFYMGNSTDVMFFFQQGCDEFPRVARVGELVARDDAGRGPRDADGVRGG